MSIGKLYRLSDNQFMANINYRLHDGSTNWWGELTITGYLHITDGDEYIIELEDKLKGKCRLRRTVNRAVSGVPPRYIYRFTSTDPLE